MHMRFIRIAVASSVALILCSEAVFAGPQVKISSKQLNAQFFDDSEQVGAYLFHDNTGNSFAFLSIYSYVDDQYVLYCEGRPGADALQINGSATAGSLAFSSANMNCDFGSFANVLVVCKSGGTFEYSSVGQQSLKDLNGTRIFHGKVQVTAAACTIEVDDRSWVANYGDLITTQDR